MIQGLETRLRHTYVHHWQELHDVMGELWTWRVRWLLQMLRLETATCLWLVRVGRLTQKLHRRSARERGRCQVEAGGTETSVCRKVGVVSKCCLGRGVGCVKMLIAQQRWLREVLVAQKHWCVHSGVNVELLVCAHWCVQKRVGRGK